MPDQSEKDILTLAEAARIRDDKKRRAAVRKALRDDYVTPTRTGRKKEGDRDADVFAGEGSEAAKLKARRQAVEAGDLEGAPEAYRTGKYTPKE